MAASPLFNGNPDYASMKNPTTEHGGGEQLIPQTDDSQQMGYAAAAAKAFIDKYVPGTSTCIKSWNGRPAISIPTYLQGCDVYGLE